MNEILLLGLIAVAVVFCEIVSGKQRAETDNKIDEIHGWLKRQHPYRYNAFTDGDNNEVKSNTNETN